MIAEETKVEQKLAHRTVGIRKGCIGLIHYWGFKGHYIFLNYEKGKVENIKSEKEVQIISHEEFDRIYKEKNVHEGNEREKQYGKLHETMLKVWGSGSTDKTGKWSMDFARDIMMMNGIVETYKEVCQHYGKISLKAAGKQPLTSDIAMKHMMPRFNDSEKSLSDKAFDEIITESEIKEVFANYKALPEDWKTDRKMPFSEESKHYLQIIPAAAEIKIKKVNIESIIAKEQKFIDGLKNKSVKIDYNGHAPYGRGIEKEILEKIAKRTSEGKPEASAVDRFIGKKIFEKKDCYYCGRKISYDIKSENEILAFATVNEDYYDNIELGRIPEEDYFPCELKDKKKRIHKFTIECPSGEIMFDNYFADKDSEYLCELPEGEEYSDKYSLQTLKGRFNRQDYLAKTFNLGYAQMGNMSVDIYLSKDKQTIIVGSNPKWSDNYDKHKEYNKKFLSNHKKLGDISLSVWRWECIDKANWEKLENRPKDFTPEVIAKVKPGVYEITHYGLEGEVNGKVCVYSEIKFKKNLTKKNER